MKLSNFNGNQVTLQVTRHELVIFNNALNEVCNALDIWEFSTRMGAEKEQVAQLLQQISATIDEIEKQPVDRR